MRSPTASLAAMLLFAAVSSVDGCANRGMVAPSDGGTGGLTSSTGGSGGARTGSGGAAGQHGSGGSTGGHGTGGILGTGGTGTGGTAGRGTGGTAGTSSGSGGQGGHGGGGNGGSQGGRGGTGGKGGAGGSANHDAGTMTDAPVDHPSQCKALFNFESGTQGAMLGTTQQAFTQLAVSSTDTFCGSGALALTAAFNGMTGPTTLGEVVLPLGADGGTVDLTGKTLTVNAAASGATGTSLKLTVVLITSAGIYVPISDVFLSSSWTIKTAVLAADAGGIDSVISIAIDVSSFTGYSGTVFLDEIDIH